MTLTAGSRELNGASIPGRGIQPGRLLHELTGEQGMPWYAKQTKEIFLYNILGTCTTSYDGVCQVQVG
jgi:hypothetical protein